MKNRRCTTLCRALVRGKVQTCVHYLYYYLHDCEHCARHCARPLQGNERMAACSALAANSAAQGVCKRHARHCAPPLRGEVRGPWRQQRPTPGCAGFHAHPLRRPVRGLVHSPWALNLPRMTPCTDLWPGLAQHLRRAACCMPAAHIVPHPSVHKAEHKALHASLRRPCAAYSVAHGFRTGCCTSQLMHLCVPLNCLWNRRLRAYVDTLLRTCAE